MNLKQHWSAKKNRRPSQAPESDSIIVYQEKKTAIQPKKDFNTAKEDHSKNVKN